MPGRLLTPLLTLLTLPILVSAGLSQTAPVEYRLNDDSSYIVGCYAPCTCPLFFTPELTGTMQLTRIAASPGLVQYAVGAVDWTLGPAPGLSVAGLGTYELVGSPPTRHQLRLDLIVDGGQVQSFDSGLVPGGGSFPVIDLAISMNGMVCYDQVFIVKAEPTELGASYCASLPNSTGFPATIRAEGSVQVAANDFSLIAESCPPSGFGLFFFGASQTSLPLGEGLLCVGTPFHRVLPPLAIDPGGSATRALDLTAPPAAGRLVSGTTWNFQFWYRDPTGGPAGFNATDGLAVGFR